jgi:hypothetical protein
MSTILDTIRRYPSWKLTPSEDGTQASTTAEYPVDAQALSKDRRVLLKAVEEADAAVTQDIVAKAVTSAEDGAAKGVVARALEAAPHSIAKAAVSEAGLTQETLDRIFLMIVETFKWVLQVATIGLIAVVGLAAFVKDFDPAHVQIMLTVFTTVAGILAGFITGQALSGGGSKNGERNTGE